MGSQNRRKQTGAMIPISATPGNSPGPARTHFRSNSFPDRENPPGWPFYHSGLAEMVIMARSVDVSLFRRLRRPPRVFLESHTDP